MISQEKVSRRFLSLGDRRGPGGGGREGEILGVLSVCR